VAIRDRCMSELCHIVVVRPNINADSKEELARLSRCCANSVSGCAELNPEQSNGAFLAVVFWLVKGDWRHRCKR
jgi:hypothetical protein